MIDHLEYLSSSCLLYYLLFQLLTNCQSIHKNFSIMVLEISEQIQRLYFFFLWWSRRYFVTLFSSRFSAQLFEAPKQKKENRSKFLWPILNKENPNDSHFFQIVQIVKLRVNYQHTMLFLSRLNKKL